MQALNAHGRGDQAERKSKGPLLQGGLVGKWRGWRMIKVKEEKGVMISSDHRSPRRFYGDAMREWRRGAEENVKEEEWEGGKAGEEGPVMGGVAVR